MVNDVESFFKLLVYDNKGDCYTLNNRLLLSFAMCMSIWSRIILSIILAFFLLVTRILE